MLADCQQSSTLTNCLQHVHQVGGESGEFHHLSLRITCGRTPKQPNFDAKEKRKQQEATRSQSELRSPSSLSKVQKSFQKDLPENRCTLPTDLLTEPLSKVASLLDSVALDVIKGDVT